MNAAFMYPVRVEAELEHPSRWLWLVKWALALPHYVVLVFLWVAFAVLSVVAFFAILFSGRYPPQMFEFNVGVLRWTWRVAYYAYGALATDRYPLFTLAEVADYPAHLEIAYPEHLSRGLVLVKWWLLAIPHYLIVGLFLGGVWFAGRGAWIVGGLIGVLTLIAAVILAITGRYPAQLFDLILGLNRWVVRVAAYAGLMTDEYPPFRLDAGGREPGTLTVQPSRPAPVLATRAAGRWTGGRVTSLIFGLLFAFTSLGLFAAGGVALWAHSAMRDASGFVTSDAVTLSSHGYAVTSDSIDIFIGGRGVAGALLGDVRLRATAHDPRASLFIGIAPTADVTRYLAGVERTVVSDLRGTSVAREIPGGHPAGPPAAQSFWVASSAGSGTQALRWPARSGSWTLVAMNARATPGLDMEADIGATFPALPWIATGSLCAAVFFFVLGLTFVIVPIVRVSREGRLS